MVAYVTIKSIKSRNVNFMTGHSGSSSTLVFTLNYAQNSEHFMRLGNIFVTLQWCFLSWKLTDIPELQFCYGIDFQRLLLPMSFSSQSQNTLLSLTLYFSDCSLTELNLFKVWERRNQVREVSGWRKKGEG